jgi:maltose O-acetyltransferase
VIIESAAAMRTEKDRMLAGELYDAADPELVADRLRARERCRALQDLPPSADAAQRRRLVELLLHAATDACITPPFFCDYGFNIRLGRNVFFNFNCVILDVVEVRIGSNVLCGPGVHIYTASHPLGAQERRAGREFGRPVVLGDDVWLGGGAIVCPGVTIGDRAVIGAGSVVVTDIPADVLAAGNPCRVVKPIG